MDDAMFKALSGVASKTVVNALISMNLGILGIKDKMDIGPSDYADFVKYRREIDYYICYHAIKDFEEIDEDDLKETSLEIHQMANKIRSMSVSTDDIVEEFIESPEGKKLASIIYRIHVPLVNEAWKATSLQVKFLKRANVPTAPATDIPQEQSASFVNEFSTAELNAHPEDVLKRFTNEHRTKR
jgi:hypothetical protein